MTNTIYYLKKEIRKLRTFSVLVNRQNMGQKYSINVTDTSLKNVAKFKYWVTTQHKQITTASMKKYRAD
jgi:hypothetical protein